MSEESTAAIADRMRLEQDLAACLKTKSVQLVNNSVPIQPGDWVGIGVSGDPNHTRAQIEHPDPVKQRLKAAITDPGTSEQDRQVAKEVLRISYHEF
jgi:hypothetical protein